jgi:hypothetical protein
MTRINGRKMKIIDQMPDESLLMVRGRNTAVEHHREREALLNGKVLQFEISPDKPANSQCANVRGYWERRMPEGTKLTVRRSIDGKYGYISVKSAPALRSVQ